MCTHVPENGKAKVIYYSQKAARVFNPLKIKIITEGVLLKLKQWLQVNSFIKISGFC